MVFEMFMLSTNESPNIVSTDNDRASTKVAENTKVDTRNDHTLNDSLQLNDTSLNETTTTNRFRFRKRSHANIFHDISSDSDSSLSTPKKSKLQNIVITADYEFVECFRHGSVRKRLFDFYFN
uniref:Uncharacterized protein n=1 Tax=Panagrolaimus superbus TaxID=310955 RepID=A0A914YW37_9BILA